MGRLTSCNYCSRKFVVKQAEKEGKKTKIVYGRGIGPTLVVYPEGADPMEPHPERADELKYFAASFMELPSRCCC